MRPQLEEAVQEAMTTMAQIQEDTVKTKLYLIYLQQILI